MIEKKPKSFCFCCFLLVFGDFCRHAARFAGLNDFVKEVEAAQEDLSAEDSVGLPLNSSGQRV